MPVVVCTYFLIMAVLTYYALCKEREAMGCPCKLSFEQHCSDMNSDFVKPSIPQQSDSVQTTLDKLQETGKSFEKLAVWRRSLILANLQTLIVFVLFHKLIIQSRDWDLFIPLHLTMFTINYLHFNYQNYHVHRKVKENVFGLVEKLRLVTKGLELVAA